MPATTDPKNVDVLWTAELRSKVFSSGITVDQLVAAVEAQGFVVSLPTDNPHGQPWDEMSSEELRQAAQWCMREGESRARQRAAAKLYARANT